MSASVIALIAISLIAQAIGISGDKDFPKFDQDASFVASVEINDLKKVIY